MIDSKMQTVYINGFFLSQTVSGVQRFALNLLFALDEKLNHQNNHVEYICLIPKNIQIDFKNIQLKVVKSYINIIDNKQALWEQLVLPFAASTKLLINLCNFAPFFKKNQLVIVHDSFAFDYPKYCSILWGLYFRTCIRLVFKYSKYIGSVSQFSANQLLKYTNSCRKIFILGNSGEHILHAIKNNIILKTLSLKYKGYILIVYSQHNMPHKNLDIIYQILQDIKMPIVVVGKGINVDNLIFTGRISDESLRALYEGALLFIFPSFYEGFGIPILESFHCNTPCIVADIPVFHEICENAALFFNPKDKFDLILKINTLSEDVALQKKLISLGKIQASKYSWHSSLLKLLQIINACFVN